MKDKYEKQRRMKVTEGSETHIETPKQDYD